MISKASYKNFAECQQHTNDSHWKDIFYSCSLNKFPKGIKYDNVKEVIHVKYESNGKIQANTFPVPQTTEELNKLMMYIFKDLLNIRSENDIKTSRMELEKIRKQNEVDINCEWKKLKPRSVKNHMLMLFSSVEVKKYQLEPKHAGILFKTIQLGFLFKKLTSNDVNYKDGSILSITGLKFNNDTRNFELTNIPGTISRTNSSTPKLHTIEKAIDKWAKDYKSELIIL